MKKLFVALLLSLAFISCAEDEIIHALSEAEVNMLENPEQSLKILESIDAKKLTTRKQTARHALLYSIALDKNYIDIASDSIIAPAVRYYSRHGSTDDKLLTLYYEARIQYNAQNYNEAVLTLMDFIKNTVDAAKKELDAVSPYSFDYMLTAAKSAEVNKNRKGRPTVTSITFFPKHNLMNEATDAIRKSVDPSMMLDRIVYNLLKEKFGFDAAGIKANITLFDIAQKEFDLFEFLQHVAPKALRANSPQGYVINAIRKNLREHYGVVIQDNIILRDKKLEKKSKPGRGEIKSLSDIFTDEQ